MSVDKLVTHLFRESAGQLTSWLVRRVVDGRLDVAEDAVQFAMVQALRAWPFQGVPERPSAWLARVARNRAIVLLRSEQRAHAREKMELDEGHSQSIRPSTPN